ncbi:SDR family NAD(P)-dependent oxidoreductase, partial [Streptomyces sp. NPDC127044]
MAIMGRLAGKIAFISGTGAGIGRAAAQVFAAEGATVFGCDLDADAAVEVVAGAPVVLEDPVPLDVVHDPGVPR